MVYNLHWFCLLLVFATKSRCRIPLSSDFWYERDQSLNSSLGFCLMEKIFGYENITGRCVLAENNAQRWCASQHGSPKATIHQKNNKFCPAIQFQHQLQAIAYNRRRVPCYLYIRLRRKEQGVCTTHTHHPGFMCLGANLTEIGHPGCKHLFKPQLFTNNANSNLLYSNMLVYICALPSFWLLFWSM
uniref:Uncharacterized LOC101242801 n=1 Tax=Ciona intestinalis TaxID=7719 RepID=H2XR48_CIOIN|nr:uncharacterized protein LOC101242801 [Ciona intestinalis]|eukprot:XP_004226819.1 uncharacterized protein LOC101242801 [Ciona intestinalis]